MHEVHPNLLWIGHALELRNPRALFSLGISAVVDVAYEELPAQLPRQLIYCRFPINDGGGNDPALLRQTIQTLVDLWIAGTPVLVGCSAGLSRSPIFSAMALSVCLDQSPVEVINRIAAVKSLEISGVLWHDALQVLPYVKRR